MFFSKSLVKKSTIFKLNPSISNSSDKSIGNVSLSDSYIHHSSQEDINPLLKGKKINTKILLIVNLFLVVRKWPK